MTAVRPIPLQNSVVCSDLSQNTPPPPTSSVLADSWRNARLLHLWRCRHVALCRLLVGCRMLVSADRSHRKILCRDSVSVRGWCFRFLWWCVFAGKMAQKLSMQDKKEMDKFIKFFALKATQIIVQSRLGEKVSTPCKPNTSGTDWVGVWWNNVVMRSLCAMRIIQSC